MHMYSHKINTLVFVQVWTGKNPLGGKPKAMRDLYCLFKRGSYSSEILKTICTYLCFEFQNLGD